MVDKLRIKSYEVDCPLCGGADYLNHAVGMDYEYNTCKNLFEYVFCRNCDIIYLKNRPSISDLSVIYPDNYYSFNISDEKKGIGLIMKDIIEKSKIKHYLSLVKSSPKVVDLGCADGRMLSIFEETGIKKDDLYGVEICESAVEKVRLKGYNVYSGLFEDMPDINEEMDLVIVNQVIEHVSDPVEMLRKIYNLLSPNGVVVIETVNIDSLDHFFFSKSYWGGYHIPRHWTLFSKISLESILVKLDFSIESSKCMLSPVFWILSFHNMLIKKKYNWLAKYFNFRNPFFLSIFSAVDLLLLPFSKTSNIQVIARKD